MDIENVIKLIACPDCKGSLRKIEINQQLLGFFCAKCKLIYPIKDEIFIILPKNARNYFLEYKLIENMKKKISDQLDNGLEKYIDNTLKILKSVKDVKSWEWEDEEFWDGAYKKEAKVKEQKNWNDRIWQREFLVEQLIKKTNLNGKIILDVGCGEGQNFRLLLSKYCGKKTLYIATDISFEGLKLNLKRNNHKNSIYVLSTADKLPFHKQTINVLCYFGILHHTERKTSTIPEDSKLVKKGGFILIHEAVAHPTFSTYLPGLSKLADEQSAHEERVDKIELLSQINNNRNLNILSSKEIYSIILTIMIEFFSRLVINNKALFNLISGLDVFSIKLLRNITPIFQAGEILLLVKKS